MKTFIITEEEAIRISTMKRNKYKETASFLLPMSYYLRLDTRQRVAVLESSILIKEEGIKMLLQKYKITAIITNCTELRAKYEGKVKMYRSIYTFEEGYTRYEDTDDYPLGLEVEEEYAVQGNHAFISDKDGIYKYLPYVKIKGTQVQARNAEQAIAINRLNKYQKDAIHLITGSFGSGKTYLTTAYALSTGRKINYITTNKTVDGATDIGFIPGSLEEKCAPSIAPLVDIVGIKEVEKMLESGKLEIIPLAYLRGRNLEGITICSEAQNITLSHLALLIGRIAEGGVLIVEGDQKQKDIKEKSGIDFLKNLEEVHYTHLPTIERSAVARLAAKLLEV